jgi:hypothetical protein
MIVAGWFDFADLYRYLIFAFICVHLRFQKLAWIDPIRQRVTSRRFQVRLR